MRSINTQYFYYLIEIERVNSLNRAAENLYIAQPNLSRILKEIEKDIGFAIFERSSDGVKPTERGNEYLKHVHRVVYELEATKQLQPSRYGHDRLRICIPHSANWFDCITTFLIRNSAPDHVDAAIHESHAQRTLDMMNKNSVGLGVIRIRSEYLPYFEKQIRAADLRYKIIAELEFKLTAAIGHPYEDLPVITSETLWKYPEISHSDDYFLPGRHKDKYASKFYITDRHAQFEMLQTIPDAWMWLEPMNDDKLSKNKVFQRICDGLRNSYTDLLIWRDEKLLTSMESKLLDHLRSL